jgi:hypothetical protein
MFGFKRGKWLAWLFLLLVVGLWLGSELRWRHINSPHGRFTTVRQYLDCGRMPLRVCQCVREGRNYWIAYGPVDTGLAVPSGSAAYVFDDTGKVVAWSFDTGDDNRFWKDWPRENQEMKSLDDLKKLAEATSFK